MIAQELIADALAAEMLAGVWTRQGLQSRARKMLGARSGKALRRLISDVMEQSQTGYPPSPDRLVACLLSSSAFGQATALIRKRRRPPATVLAPARFNPSPAFAGLDVPRLATPSELAAWLEVNVSQLDWLADAKKQNARATDPRIHHYVYALIPRRSGGLRLIESPKPRLKAIQRRILHEILEKAPVHERACGFVSGRSCRDGAQLHASEFVVAATDLKEFFPSTPLMRVHALFRRFGYPWAVARLLTGLCSTTTPPHALARAAGIGEDWGARRLYAAPHLPQGAPTSPALANLSAWRLDRRLSGLSRVFDANYSRYADDLAFSGDEGFAGKIGRFLALVAQIVGEEGFALNAAKTRIMRQSGRQIVTGVVVNDHLNLPRKAFDELKAILHNCIVRGPRAENSAMHPDFRAHLDGRVNWAESLNPVRGAKLRRAFERIEW